MIPEGGRMVDWFSLSHTYSDSLKATCTCAIIERVLKCPRKPFYIILLPITFTGKKP